MKMMQNDNRTAITYYRYSSHRQGEQSIEGQRAEAERWAKANGYTIVKEYADRAMTGTNDDRDQFQLMLRELERLRPAVLILWKVDRMGRNKEEIAFNKYRCKKNGVKVIYTAESIPDTPEGVILESVLEGMAEYYSLQLSQNVRRGHRVSASKCQSTGGACPLGYRVGPDKHLEIDPEKAAIVRQVFERYANGETQPEIIQSLNEQGLRTLRGKPFSRNSLRTLLKNEKYIGVYTYNHGEVRVEGGVPAIIDVEMFQKAQKMLKFNKRSSSHKWTKANYLLTGKLFCGCCGEQMCGVSGYSSTKVKYHYYACSGHHNYKKARNTCRKKNVKKEWIEGLVLREAKLLLLNEDLLDFIAENTYQYYVEANTDTAYTDALQANLREIERSLENIMRAVEAGIFNDTTKARMEELEAQKQQIRHALDLTKLDRGLQLTKDHILYFLKRFRDLDFENAACQRQIIDTFINSVFVYDDHITLTFNYSGDDRTITLAETDAAAGGESFVFAPSCGTIMRRYELIFIVRNVFALTIELEDC